MTPRATPLGEEIPRVYKDTTQNIRCTSEEKQTWKQAAPEGKVSRWARQVLNEAARAA